ncbi:MAG: acyl-CoA dehydrogenase, partial [Candidatus Omnitrophica bacterium]|nr:acyl-CoA dehydrogenase [Candidatus Omnitrophota bacterium]
AAMAKPFGSEVTWAIADQTLQIRGGRGYETADSLKARGEKPVPVERIFRDLRINLIIEGTSEIMHLFIAREALDPHIQLAFDMILPDRSFQQRLKTAGRAALFYSGWYPRLWIPRFPGGWPQGLPARLRGHWAFVESASRRLARSLFHEMVKHQQRLEKRQMLLFRIVDVGVDLFAMSATLSRAAWLQGQSPAGDPADLADLFCRHARGRVLSNLSRLDRPEDRQGYRLAEDLLSGSYSWLESGIVR